ncbi:MAG: hypothetical protein H6670_18950 [Anaerolineaceae bacterium]|nr:hypothetical protein [Anaerolineaceae bacterium]
MMFLNTLGEVQTSHNSNLLHAIWSPDYDHPIFVRYRLPVANKRRWLLSVGWFFATVGLIAAITMLLLHPSNMLFMVMLMILGAPLATLALNGWLLGILFTSAIVSNLLAHGVVVASDLVRVSKIGTFDVSVLVATATLHRRDRLNRLHGAIRSIVGVALIVCVVAGILIFINIANAASNPQTLEVAHRWLAALIPIACIFIMIYLDFHYATSAAILSALVALQVKGFRHALSGYFSAIGVFFLMYVLPYVIALVTLIALRIGLASSWLLTIVPIVVVILLMTEIYLIRQMIVAAIWKWLRIQY